MTEAPSDASESMRQLSLVWEMFVRDYGAGDVLDADGLAIRWANSLFPFWNTLTLTEPRLDADRLDARLAAAAGYMARQPQAGFLWLFEDLLTEDARHALPAAARRAGLALSLSGHGMAGDILPLPAPAHSDLTFERVTAPDQLRAYADINSRAYGLPLETARDGLGNSALWRDGMHAYLACKGGQPVAAAATVAAGDCLFVALVATEPSEQRRGYGEAVTRKALHEGAAVTGLRRATLHATLAGAPVYERIGLERVGPISFFGLAPQPGGAADPARAE